MAVPPFFAFTKEIPKNTKENIPSDHCCSHVLMEGRISLIPSPDCCIFIAVSKNTHIVHLRRHNSHMAIWPFGHYGVKWPYSHMVVMASKVAIMGVFGNSYKNAAIWWRNQVDLNFLPQMRAKMVWRNIFLCIFWDFLCKHKKWWHRHKNALKLLKFFLVAPEV